MKCHDCNKTMTRSELKKHVCKPYKSPSMSEKWRAYLKHFGSRPVEVDLDIDPEECADEEISYME